MKLYKVGDQTFSTKSEAARYIGIPRTTFRNRLDAGSGSFDSPKGKVVEDEVSEKEEASLPPLLKQISERYSVEEQKLLANGINPLAEQIRFPEACFTGKKFRF